MADLLTEIEQGLVSGEPLSDLLRKCMLLGGQAGSVSLREWANRELRGYSGDDHVPEYRTRGVILCVDAVVGYNQVKGQRISQADLPDFVQDTVGEEFTFRQGVGELEKMVPDGEDSVRLSFPMASKVAEYMDRTSGQPFQHITAIYWFISRSTVDAVLDQVRTSLTELVAEMRAGTRQQGVAPSAQVADRAVSIIAGDGARITVTQATGGDGSSPAASTGDRGRAFSGDRSNVSIRERVSAWSTTKKLLSGIAGAASIFGLGLAVWQLMN